MSKQPRDNAGHSIPVLSLKRNRGMIVPFTTSANSSPTISSDVLVVSLYSTVDCFIELGATANVSNSHFLPKNVGYDVSLIQYDTQASYISVIGNSSGTLYVSERI